MHIIESFGNGDRSKKNAHFAGLMAEEPRYFLYVHSQRDSKKSGKIIFIHLREFQMNYTD